MLRISQLKLKIDHTEKELAKKIEKTLRIKNGELLSYSIKKQSIDARKKPELYFVYTIDAVIIDEEKFLKRNRDKKIIKVTEKTYQMPVCGNISLIHSPVIVGSGPAGLFCAYLLASAGYKPIVIERGMPVEDRVQDVEAFWKNGVLKPESNVQFGEGGAGTFSDGKLNTLVKDTYGRGKKVLEIFVEHGAPKDILFVNKPHIGTDVLVDVVRNLREHIIQMGGEVHFHTKLTELITDQNQRVTGIRCEDILTGKPTTMECEQVVLAIGHSARDTFEALYEKGVPMEAKSFAVGVRIEHPQTMIDQAQYGMEHTKNLSAAAYKLTANLANKRGVYTFCMCPGGYVVNASSEKGRLAVNGMSYHARDGRNANSAVIVTVTPEDYGANHPLSGIAFQRRLEECAYRAGGGKVPVQLFGDYCKDQISQAFGAVTPQIKGAYTFGDVRGIFPKELANSIEEGIRAFDTKIAGYARKDALLSGVESRTSSPVRILRGEQMESSISGLYPCGEGAGYAGGITSAAMDGIKVAEAIIKRHAPFDTCANG